MVFQYIGEDMVKISEYKTKKSKDGKRLGILNDLHTRGVLQELAESGESYFEMQKEASVRMGYRVWRGTIYSAFKHDSDLMLIYETAREHRLEEDAKQVTRSRKEVADLETRLHKAWKSIITEMKKEDVPMFCAYLYYKNEQYRRKPFGDIRLAYESIYAGVEPGTIADRCSMNRNTIYGYKKKMIKICEQNDLPQPAEPRKNPDVTLEVEKLMTRMIPKIGFKFTSNYLMISYAIVEGFAKRNGLKSPFITKATLAQRKYARRYVSRVNRERMRMD